MLTRGFSLLELLMVISIIAILATIATGSYRNYVKNIELDSTAKTIVADLKNARSKAVSGEDNVKWGLHFVNGADDYYELFSTPTTYADAAKVVKSTSFLHSGITFSSPAEGFSSDIIFNKIDGTTTTATVSIVFEGSTKTMTVSAVGNIY